MSTGKRGPSLAGMVFMGLAADAVRLAAIGAFDRDDLAADLAELRAAGFTEEAKVIELAASNRDAALLLLPPTGRMLAAARFVVLVAAVAGLVLEPWLAAVPPVGALVWLVRWYRARRRGLSDEEARVIRRWFRLCLVSISPDVKNAAGLVAGFGALLAAMAVLAGAPLVAVGVLLISVTPLAVIRLIGGLATPEVGSPVVRGAIPSTSAAGGGRDRALIEHLRSRDVRVPLVVDRPRLLFAGMPAVLAGISAVFLLFQGRNAAVWSAAFLVVAVMLASRAATTRLELNESSIRDKTLIRTRVFPWSAVHEVRVKDDGELRARLEIVTSQGATHTLWSGPSSEPLLLELLAVGRALAAGPPPPGRLKRMGAALITVILVTFASLTTLSALAAPFVEPVVEVDPARVPPGTDLHVLVDSAGRPRSGPRMHCPSLVERLSGEDVAVCAAGTRQSVIGLAVTATLSAGAWVLVGWRGRRRRRSLADVGPMPWTPPGPQ